MAIFSLSTGGFTFAHVCASLFDCRATTSNDCLANILTFYWSHVKLFLCLIVI